MTYLLASNNSILKFPYSLEELYSDNPNTSFPREMSEEELANWGVFTVEDEPAPTYNEQTESIEIQPPCLTNGIWIRRWETSFATTEEIKRRTDLEASNVRKRRNELLIATDHTQLGDYPKNADLEAYKRLRQRYRDIPQQKGFPWNVLIPTLDIS